MARNLRRNEDNVLTHPNIINIVVRHLETSINFKPPHKQNQQKEKLNFKVDKKRDRRNNNNNDRNDQRQEQDNVEEAASAEPKAKEDL